MNYLYDLLEDFLSLLFPRLCYACGDHLMRNEKLICTGCHVMIPRTSYHLEPDNPVAQVFWGRCQIQKAAAFSYYNKGSRVRHLIHNLKYKGIKEIGIELGSIYGPILERSGFTAGIDLIIPVPLHPSKEKLRGFNQSELISQGIAQSTGLPVTCSALSRIAMSSTQTRRSRYDRWTNVEGIFKVVDPDQIAGRHVLLVDDVITTGSTIESCVNELLKTEGVTVSVVAIAAAII
jgi:ComF family protein